MLKKDIPDFEAAIVESKDSQTTIELTTSNNLRYKIINGIIYNRILEDKLESIYQKTLVDYHKTDEKLFDSRGNFTQFKVIEVPFKYSEYSLNRMLTEDQITGYATAKNIELTGNENIKPEILYVNRIQEFEDFQLLLSDEMIKENITKQLDKYLPLMISKKDMNDPKKIEDLETILIPRPYSNSQFLQPIFLPVGDGSHWSMIAIIPDPINKHRIGVVYMNSMPGEGLDGYVGLGKNEAQMVVNYLQARGLEVIGGRYINRSQNQQCNNSCGLAAASNIADLNKLYLDLVTNAQPLTEDIIKKFEPTSLPSIDKFRGRDNFQNTYEAEARRLFESMDVKLQILKSATRPGIAIERKPFINDKEPNPEKSELIVESNSITKQESIIKEKTSFIQDIRNSISSLFNYLKSYVATNSQKENGSNIKPFDKAYWHAQTKESSKKFNAKIEEIESIKQTKRQENKKPTISDSLKKDIKESINNYKDVIERRAAVGKNNRDEYIKIALNSINGIGQLQNYPESSWDSLKSAIKSAFESDNKTKPDHYQFYNLILKIQAAQCKTDSPILNRCMELLKDSSSNITNYKVNSDISLKQVLREQKENALGILLNYMSDENITINSKYNTYFENLKSNAFDSYDKMKSDCKTKDDQQREPNKGKEYLKNIISKQPASYVDNAEFLKSTELVARS